MSRWGVLLAIAVAFACSSDAGAAPKAQKAAKAAKAASEPKRPLHLYLAKGEANACGEGCNEWIAVEGWFDVGAAGRAQAFLKRHAARKLPVYFHSPGGSGPDAITIGRQLRQLGLTTAVGATVPRGCASAFDYSTACAAAKRSTQAIAAELRPDASCNSACVWALFGGKDRHVPPSARLGIHSGKLTLMRKWSDGRVEHVSPQEALHKTRLGDALAATRRYIRDMGIDTAVLDRAQKVRHEDVHYLSRNEIAAYGIDRREFVETPWFFSHFSSSNNSYVSKWMVDARGGERKDYRVSIIAIACSSALNASVRYLRGLTSDELEQPAAATVSIGKHKARLALSGKGRKQDAVDSGSMFSSASSLVPFAEIEAAVADGSIGIAVGPRENAEASRVMTLSTHGLPDAIKLLREKCVPSIQPAPWAGGTQVPFVPAQAGDHAAPASPYGALPAPEQGLGTAGGRASKEKKR